MLELQNGSDIRGIAISTEESNANLTPEKAEKIAIGILTWLEKRDPTKKSWRIAIGHDSRLSAEELKAGLIEGFLGSQVELIDVGLATTPAMFMATQFPEYDCDAALMITASHLPYYFNGIKIFSKTGGAEKEDITYILENSHKPHSVEKKGNVKKRNLIPDYAADLVKKIRRGIPNGEEKPLSGFHILVDAGNGAGGFFAKEVLEPLGATTTGSQFLEPDGHFPNHIPNPDNKEAMASVRQAVIEHQADLGVIFDTDVDRAAVVDQSGESINRNQLIAVLAKIVLTEHPGSAIVTNSPTSSHLKTFIEELGGQQVRYLCGYRNVINKAIELNQSGINTELAIETSGHAAFKENYFLDDGAYVIAKILMLLPKLRAEKKSLADLITQLKQPAEANELRFKIEEKNYHSRGEEIIIEFEKWVQEQPNMEIDFDNEEGVRANVSAPYGSGWFLLRMSLHEPLLVLQVENDVLGMNRKVITVLNSFFEKQPCLNCSALKQYLSE